MIASRQSIIQKGRIPRMIYEALPFVYAAVGISTIANNDITLGRLSGALLLSAAVAIHTLRHVYRRTS